MVRSSLWSCQEVWIKWLLSVWLHETEVAFRSSHKNNSCWFCMLKCEEVREKHDTSPRLHRSSSYSGRVTVSHRADVHVLTAYRAVTSALLRMPSHPLTMSFFLVNHNIVDWRTCTFHMHVFSTHCAPAIFPIGLSLRQTSSSGSWNREESRTRHIKLLLILVLVRLSQCWMWKNWSYEGQIASIFTSKLGAEILCFWGKTEPTEYPRANVIQDYEKCLRELRLFCLEKRKFRRDLITLCNKSNIHLSWMSF